ncbi:conserved hypothetical protein [Ricinus communis]|uniref:Uncharacterized protein n=1 Tax=Ricinus communis TaxID=3988 RepID=B9RWZ3_RICCO|nr:conserved hypothetical protein [Ricinus communis]
MIFGAVRRLPACILTTDHWADSHSKTESFHQLNQHRQRLNTVTSQRGGPIGGMDLWSSPMVEAAMFIECLFLMERSICRCWYFGDRIIASLPLRWVGPNQGVPTTGVLRPIEGSRKRARALGGSSSLALKAFLEGMVIGFVTLLSAIILVPLGGHIALVIILMGLDFLPLYSSMEITYEEIEVESTWISEMWWATFVNEDFFNALAPLPADPNALGSSYP